MVEKESQITAGTQHTALTQAAGYAALDRTLLEFTGPDRVSFLHNLTTNQVKALTPGHGCELFVPSLQGKVTGHGYLFCGDDSLVFDGVADQAAALLKHFGKYRIREKVEFHDRSLEWAELALAGPQSPRLLARLAEQDPPSTLHGHARVTLGGRQVTVRRVDYLGTPTFFLTCPADQAAALGALLEGAGATACARLALEMARLEGGFPDFGRDMTPDNLCQEVNRTAEAISFTKGCYLGQETIARIDSMGHVNKLLVGLSFLGETVPEAGAEVRADGKPVGAVTTAVMSPRLSAPLALGYVRSAQAKAGTKLESALGPVTVVAFPIV